MGRRISLKACWSIKYYTQAAYTKVFKRDPLVDNLTAFTLELSDGSKVPTYRVFSGEEGVWEQCLEDVQETVMSQQLDNGTLLFLKDQQANTFHKRCQMINDVVSIKGLVHQDTLTSAPAPTPVDPSNHSERAVDDDHSEDEALFNAAGGCGVGFGGSTSAVSSMNARKGLREPPAKKPRMAAGVTEAEEEVGSLVIELDSYINVLTMDDFENFNQHTGSRLITKLDSKAKEMESQGWFGLKEKLQVASADLSALAKLAKLVVSSGVLTAKPKPRSIPKAIEMYEKCSERENLETNFGPGLRLFGLNTMVDRFLKEKSFDALMKVWPLADFTNVKRAFQEDLGAATTKHVAILEQAFNCFIHLFPQAKSENLSSFKEDAVAFLEGALKVTLADESKQRCQFLLRVVKVQPAPGQHTLTEEINHIHTERNGPIYRVWFNNQFPIGKLFYEAGVVCNTGLLKKSQASEAFSGIGDKLKACTDALSQAEAVPRTFEESWGFLGEALSTLAILGDDTEDAEIGTSDMENSKAAVCRVCGDWIDKFCAAWAVTAQNMAMMIQGEQGVSQRILNQVESLLGVSKEMEEIATSALSHEAFQRLGTNHTDLGKKVKIVASFIGAIRTVHTSMSPNFVGNSFTEVVRNVSSELLDILRTGNKEAQQTAVDRLLHGFTSISSVDEMFEDPTMSQTDFVKRLTDDTSIMSTLTAIRDGLVKPLRSEIPVIYKTAMGGTLMKSQIYLTLKGKERFLTENFLTAEKISDFDTEAAKKLTGMGIKTVEKLFDVLRSFERKPGAGQLLLGLLEALPGTVEGVPGKDVLMEAFALSDRLVDFIPVLHSMRMLPAAIRAVPAKAASTAYDIIMKSCLPFVTNLKATLDTTKGLPELFLAYTTKAVELCYKATIDDLIPVAEAVREKIPTNLDNLVQIQAAENLRAMIFESDLLTDTMDVTSLVEGAMKKRLKVIQVLTPILPTVANCHQDAVSRLVDIHAKGKEFSANVKALDLILNKLPTIPDKEARSPLVRGRPCLSISWYCASGGVVQWDVVACRVFRCMSKDKRKVLSGNIDRPSVAALSG